MPWASVFADMLSDDAYPMHAPLGSHQYVKNGVKLLIGHHLAATWPHLTMWRSVTRIVGLGLVVTAIKDRHSPRMLKAR
jgi:hypothetical protein